MQQVSKDREITSGFFCPLTENTDLDLNSGLPLTLTSGKLFTLSKAKLDSTIQFLWMSSCFNDCPPLDSTMVINEMNFSPEQTLMA